MSPKSKIYFGWGLLLLSNLIPLLLWFSVEPVSGRFFNLNANLTSLGQIFGLLGLSLFACVIILSVRLGFMEKYFNGLNRIYLNHHRLGALALVLLLFHPLWLVIKYALQSSYAATLFILPSAYNPAKTMGIVSLLLMIILLAITFYASWRYHLWKISHKFLGLAFALGFAHTLLIPSDVSRHLGLRLYFIALCALAFIAIIYRVIFPRFFVKKYHYTVAKIEPLNYDITELTLRPTGERLAYTAGQFAFFRFTAAGVRREFHPFSFVSDPRDELIKIAFKSLGDFTATLGSRLTVGTPVEIEGPFGCFLCQGQKQLWLAGGIGAAPFVSHLKNISPDARIDFFWSVVNESEILWRADWEDLALKNKNFHFYPHISSRAGWLTAEKIKAQCPDLSEREIFLCGPPAMMKSLRKQLINMGVKNQRIHSEEFSL